MKSSRLVQFCFVTLALGSVTLRAQVEVKPSTGRHFYALVDRATGQVVQRGTTGEAGIAFDRLILAPETNYRIWVLEAAHLLTGYVDVTSPPVGRSLRF